VLDSAIGATTGVVVSMSMISKASIEQAIVDSAEGLRRGSTLIEH
jgi:hypothetical protein